VHVLEEPRDATRFERVTVRVEVAPQSEEPLPPLPDTALAVAQAALEGARAEDTIVRRYASSRPRWCATPCADEDGTPRAVLDGDFDLFE
jgi:hypothetical protein